MGEANEDNIYFIDAYSKTFPTEDRARIFEYLFKTENGTLSPSIRGSHLIEKCRALCIILRKVFPSVAAEDSVFWESGLGSIDEGELDVFIARFREYEKKYAGKAEASEPYLKLAEGIDEALAHRTPEEGNTPEEVIRYRDRLFAVLLKAQGFFR